MHLSSITYYDLISMADLKSFILIICWQLIPLIASSQSDYAVTAKGDTLRGTIKIIRSGELDRIQINNGSKKKNYTTLLIKAAEVDGTIYHTIKLNKDQHLMKLLKSGYLSLYGYRTDTEITYSRLLLRKVTGDILDIPNLKFRAAIKTFLDDCDSVSQNIKENKLNNDDLEEIVDMYNQCVADNAKQRADKSKLQSTKESKKSKLVDFKKQIELSSITTKQEVIDILNDMITKVDSNKEIPAYQTDALQNYLKDNKEFQESLTQLLSELK